MCACGVTGSPVVILEREGTWLYLDASHGFEGARNVGEGSRQASKRKRALLRSDSILLAAMRLLFFFLIIADSDK